MRVTATFLVFICVPVFVFSQSSIENSEKPLSKNAGRILALQKVCQIDDPGDDYYFQYPRNPRIAPDGSIFLQDSEQMLHFDLNGEFIRNYYIKGQGPGEMMYLGDYSFFLEGFVMQNINPSKMMWFDFSGELIKEVTIQTKSRLQYLFYSKDHYYFIQSEFPRIKGEPQIVDSLETLVVMGTDNNIVKLADLPTKQYVVMGKSGGGGSIPLNNLIVASYKNKYLFISHTQEYSIKIFDAELNQITKKVNREFPRVKQVKEDSNNQGGPIIDGKQMLPPAQKYINDIDNLFVVGENLWVQTSLKDNESRTMFDIFDFNGKFVDNFYLLLPQNLGPHGYNVEPIFVGIGNFIAVEKNSDESLSVVKYRIFDNGIQ